MKPFFHKKVLTPFLAVLLAAVCITGAGAFGYYQGAKTQEPGVRETEAPLTLEQLYKDAIADAVVAEEGEIYPLVTLTKEDGMAHVQGGKVLLLTVNDSPESYPAGETVTLPGEVWTFTDLEIAEWYQGHKEGVTDWPMRLQQLVGVPPDAGYTHVTAMWVPADDVIRPAYLTDVTEGSMTAALPTGVSEEYREWFNGNILWSYFDSAYPWTRLGYTYDWAPDTGEYGLTEFLICPGAEAEIAYTDEISQFIVRLENGV